MAMRAVSLTKRRITFLAAAAAALGVVFAINTSFLGTAGYVAPTSFGSPTVNDGVQTPVSGTTTTLPNTIKPGGTTSDWVASGTADAVLPAWGTTLNTPASLPNASTGDLSIVEAPSNADITVTVTLGNAAALFADYASLNIPIDVAVTSCTSSGCSAWTQQQYDANGSTDGVCLFVNSTGCATTLPTTTNTGVTSNMLTLNNTTTSILLPGSYTAGTTIYYEIFVPQGAGGEYDLVDNNTTNGGATTPTFDVSTQLG